MSEETRRDIEKHPLIMNFLCQTQALTLSSCIACNQMPCLWLRDMKNMKYIHLHSNKKISCYISASEILKLVL